MRFERELLEATGEEKLLELSMGSPIQDFRIIPRIALLQNLTSLTFSWQTRSVHFPRILFLHLQYLDVLHFHVSAFLFRGHRVKTLKLREFESSVFQHRIMSGPPAPDLGSMLAPIRPFNPLPDPTFEGITMLHISIQGLSCDVRTLGSSNSSY